MPAPADDVGPSDGGAGSSKRRRHRRPSATAAPASSLQGPADGAVDQAVAEGTKPAPAAAGARQGKGKTRLPRGRSPTGVATTPAAAAGPASSRAAASKGAPTDLGLAPRARTDAGGGRADAGGGHGQRWQAAHAGASSASPASTAGLRHRWLGNAGAGHAGRPSRWGHGQQRAGSGEGGDSAKRGDGQWRSSGRTRSNGRSLGEDSWGRANDAGRYKWAQRADRGNNRGRQWGDRTNNGGRQWGADRSGGQRSTNGWRDGDRGDGDVTAAAARPRPAPRPRAREVHIPAGVTVRQLAGLLDMDVAALEDALAAVGERPSSAEDAVPADEAELLALERGLVATCDRQPEGEAQPRPAVVAVLGHVDHGKTTLLDALRDTAVAAGEAGGITQHIGAFEVTMPASQASITFLDTPGHAAFSAMRQRGAQVTDIAVLVVDARDGVKPQTREALRHATEAGCPLVVALTKCDLPDADPERVRRELLAEGVELEDVGGSTQVVQVAAKAGRGLVELEEALLLQAEIMDLKAGRASPPEAVVVEARMDKGRGPVATVIVQSGTLIPGAPVIVGQEWGKVRSLTNPAGQAVDAVLPGHAAEVTGLRGVPQAGDRLVVLPSEDRARRLSAARAQRADEDRQADGAIAVAAAAEEAASAAAAAADGGANTAAAVPSRGRVLLLVKADTQGSCEAVRHAVEGMSSTGVDVSVVSSSVGAVTLSDVQHAAATGARVLAFNVRAGGPAVDREAKRLGVSMTAQRVIYHLMDDVAGWAAGAEPRVAREVVAGRADVLQVFRAGSGDSAVAGVRVAEGALATGETFRVLRGGEQVFEGSAASLRRHKLTVDRVGRGTECGVLLNGFQAFQAGDVVLCVATEYVPASQAEGAERA